MKYPRLLGRGREPLGRRVLRLRLRARLAEHARRAREIPPAAARAGQARRPRRGAAAGDDGVDDGRIARFLAHVWATRAARASAEVHALMNLAMAATYDPDPRAPNGFRVPFNLETGELLPQRWRRWLRHDPINLVARYARNLRTLRGIFIDCGWRDQYRMHYGSRHAVAAARRAPRAARLRGVRRHALRHRLPHGSQPAVSRARAAVDRRGAGPLPVEGRMCAHVLAAIDKLLANGIADKCLDDLRGLPADTSRRGRRHEKAMSKLEPLRYEHGRPMLFAGLRRKHTFASMGKDIPRQWDDFLKLGEAAGASRDDGLRRDLRRRSEDADDGVHVRRRGEELRCVAEGSRPHARAGRALRRVPARRQRRDDSRAPGSRSSRSGCRARACSLRRRRISRCTTSASTARRVTAASRFGSGSSRRNSRGGERAHAS